jgi:uncharacterized protein YaiI (UPF0178 family)
MGPGMIPAPPSAPRIFIDADACPVKDEVYRVAARYGLHVFVVSNSWINTPREKWIEQIVVDAGPDIADDWIAERARPGDIVVTADIPLADRCLKSGAQALKSNGQPFTPDSIGSALAGRMVGEHLRSMGVATSGPPPFGPRDRSAFLQALDQAVVRAKRAFPVQGER